MEAYQKLNPHQALHALIQLDFKVLLAYAALEFPDRDDGVWGSALETWLPWLVAHRYQPESSLPMVLPAGPVFELHTASERMNQVLHHEICLLGSGMSLRTITIEEGERFRYTSYRPIAATIERMEACQMRIGYQGKLWITSRPPFGEIKAFTVTTEQSQHYCDDWPSLWQHLSEARECCEQS